MMDTPDILAYSSIVSRYSVHIDLTVVDLNVFDLFSCDIQNAYFTAECRENIWTHAGPNFGSEAGTIMIVRMALYGLNYSGAEFCAPLAETLNDIGFLSTKADHDVC